MWRPATITGQANVDQATTHLARRHRSGGGHVIQGKTRPDGSIWTPADVIDRLPPGAIGTATADDAGDYIVTGSPIVDPDEINQLVDLADDESAVHVPKGR